MLNTAVQFKRTMIFRLLFLPFTFIFVKHSFTTWLCGQIFDQVDDRSLNKCKEIIGEVLEFGSDLWKSVKEDSHLFWKEGFLFREYFFTLIIFSCKIFYVTSYAQCLCAFLSYVSYCRKTWIQNVCLSTSINYNDV